MILFKIVANFIPLRLLLHPKPPDILASYSDLTLTHSSGGEDTEELKSFLAKFQQKEESVCQSMCAVYGALVIIIDCGHLYILSNYYSTHS